MRPRGRGAVRARRAARPVHPLDRARGGLAVAHPAAAPHGQRPRLFERSPRARRGRGAAARQPRGASRSAEPRHLSFTAGRRRLAWNAQCRLARAVERLRRAARIDQHPSRPERHRQAARAVPGPPLRSRSSATNITARCRTCSRTSATSSSSTTRRRGATIPTSGTTAGRWTCPTRLAAKLELWRSKGRVFREGRELFGTASWVAVLLGQGIVPEEVEPAALAVDPALIADALDKMRAQLSPDGRAYADPRRVHRQGLRRA